MLSRFETLKRYFNTSQTKTQAAFASGNKLTWYGKTSKITYNRFGKIIEFLSKNNWQDLFRYALEKSMYFNAELFFKYWSSDMLTQDERAEFLNIRGRTKKNSVFHIADDETTLKIAEKMHFTHDMAHFYQRTNAKEIGALFYKNSATIAKALMYVDNPTSLDNLLDTRTPGTLVNNGNGQIVRKNDTVPLIAFIKTDDLETLYRHVMCNITASESQVDLLIKIRRETKRFLRPIDYSK